MFFSKNIGTFLFFALYTYFGYPEPVAAHDGDVYSVKYTTENFSEEIPKRNHFVMFFAPWCGHCQRLSPTWEQLAEMLNEEDGNVRIATVDCTVETKICASQDITGYPTLKFFQKGKLEGVKFMGTRDLPTLTNFINEQLREESEATEMKASLTSALIELSDENFDYHVGQGKHFVKFYAPWCGHCQQLAPIWHEVAKSFEHDSSVTIAKLDCTKYKSICSQYEIKGYPSLLWIENGEKVDKYQGSRTHEDLVNYVEKMIYGKPTSKEQEDEEKVLSSEQGVNDLTAEVFKDSIQNGLTIVKFFAPWCGHCKSLAPTWENLGKKYKDSKIIKIAKVDCTAAENKGLCNDEKIDGFPTIYLYKSGEKISEYIGSRSLEDLSDFIESHIGHDEL